MSRQITILYVILLISFFLEACQNGAQETTEQIKDNAATSVDESITPYTVDEKGDTLFKTPEVPASYVTGIDNLYKDLANLLAGKYPTEAKRQGVEGKVFIEFIVDEEGNVVNPQIKKGIGSGCDEVAMEAFSKTGKWKPGRQYGKPVKTQLVIPIVFRLE